MHNLPRCSLATAPSRLDLKPVRRTHNNKFYRGLLHLTWQFQRPLTFLRTNCTALRWCKRDRYTPLRVPTRALITFVLT